MDSDSSGAMSTSAEAEVEVVGSDDESSVEVEVGKGQTVSGTDVSLFVLAKGCVEGQLVFVTACEYASILAAILVCFLLLLSYPLALPWEVSDLPLRIP